MKVRIEVDNKIMENEVIIRCSKLSEDVKNIQIMLLLKKRIKTIK